MKPKSPAWSIVASTLIVGFILAVLIYFDTDETVLLILEWCDAQGAWAPLLFTAAMALVVVLVFPGVMFTTGAGFVFGVVKGSACVIFGTTIGAALAFLIARHLFGARATELIFANAKLESISNKIAPDGWKIVLMTRLIPFFPGKISNYFFGLTQVSFRAYVTGSLVGFIPYSVHNVYLGSIAADIATLGERNVDRTPLEWSLYGIGFVVAVGSVIYLNRLARRALAEFTEVQRLAGQP
jgi:uncharacterized membrane protein YdjX (TVP38/TMEM64 family)